jgi:hypothetical protein
MTEDTDTIARVKARVRELTKNYSERQPNKLAAMRLVDRLLTEQGIPAADRQRKRAADELHVRFDIVCELFADAPVELSEFLFLTLHQIILAAITVGERGAPEGRKGREAWSDQAGSQFTKLVMALQIYCREHPEHEMQRGGFPISAKFAGRIRDDVLDALGNPEDAPSANQIVDALRAVRKRSLER